MSPQTNPVYHRATYRFRNGDHVISVRVDIWPYGRLCLDSTGKWNGRLGVDEALSGHVCIYVMSKSVLWTCELAKVRELIEEGQGFLCWL